MKGAVQGPSLRGRSSSASSAAVAFLPSTRPVSRAPGRSNARQQQQQQQQQRRRVLLCMQPSGRGGGSAGPRRWQATNDDVYDAFSKLQTTCGELMDLTSRLRTSRVWGVDPDLVRDAATRACGAGYSTSLLLWDAGSAVEYLRNVMPMANKALLQERVVQVALKHAHVKETLKLVLARVCEEIKDPSVELATSLAAARQEVSAWERETSLEKLDGLVTLLYSLAAAKGQEQYMNTATGQMLLGFKELVTALAAGGDAAKQVLMNGSCWNPGMLLLSTAALATNGGGGEECLGPASMELSMAGLAYYDPISKAVVVEAAGIEIQGGGVAQVVLSARVLGGLLTLVAMPTVQGWQQKLFGVVYKRRQAGSPMRVGTSSMLRKNLSHLPLEAVQEVGPVKVFTVLV